MLHWRALRTALQATQEEMGEPRFIIVNLTFSPHHIPPAELTLRQTEIRHRGEQGFCLRGFSGFADVEFTVRHRTPPAVGRRHNNALSTPFAFAGKRNGLAGVVSEPIPVIYIPMAPIFNSHNSSLHLKCPSTANHGRAGVAAVDYSNPSPPSSSSSGSSGMTSSASGRGAPKRSSSLANWTISRDAQIFAQFFGTKNETRKLQRYPG